MKSNLYFRLIFLSLFFLVCEKTNAQSPDWLWVKSMGGTGGGGGSGLSIAIDRSGSGNVYTTGFFGRTTDFDPDEDTFNLTAHDEDVDIFISKLNGSGHFVWAKAMGAFPYFDVGYSIAIDPSGNGDVYTTGSFGGTVDIDPGAGIFNLTSAGSLDVFISKLDSLGNLLWAKAMGGTGFDEGYSIAPDPSGSGAVYTTGIFKGTADFDPDSSVNFNLTSAGEGDIFISKLDGSGNFIWAKKIGGISFDYGNAITINGNGDVYTIGSFSETVDFNPGPGTFNLASNDETDIFVSKLDSSGNFIWAKKMGGTSRDAGNSLALDPSGSGDVFITGFFSGTADFDPGAGIFNLTSAGGNDIFISKLNGAGNFIWAKKMGGTLGDAGSSLALDPSGSGDVYTTGSFRATADFDPGPESFNLTSAGDNDIFISKLNDSGNFVWAKAVGGAEYDDASSIAVDALGHVHLSGSFESPSISFDSTILINVDDVFITPDIFIAKLNVLTTPTINIDTNTRQIILYPNPAKDKLTIEFAEDNSVNVNITLLNILGEVVFLSRDQNNTNEHIINIGKLTPGVYFVELNIDGKKVMKKVVKE